MTGLKSRFEDFHGLRYTNDAIKSAVELSDRYITDRKLPDKAIDVIDEAGAAQWLLPSSKRKKTVGQKDIEPSWPRSPAFLRNRCRATMPRRCGRWSPI